MAQLQDFISTYGPLAEDISQETGLDSAVVLGHMAQETGFGQHISGNNLFGITPNGKLAQYPDVSSAGQAYVNLMKGRYAPATKLQSPNDQIAALTNLGYGPGAADAAANPQNAAGQGYANAIATNAAKLRNAGFGMTAKNTMTPEQMEQETNPPAPPKQAMTPEQMEHETNPLPTKTPEEMEAETNPQATPTGPVMSPEDAAAMSMGGGVPANAPPQGASVPPTIALPTQQGVESYLNQPPAPGFTRSSVLPIAVNPDIHNLSGIQFDPRGPINSLTNLLQSNSPQAVAQRGNITPEMAMTLLGGAASGGGLNPLARSVPTQAFTGPEISAAQAAATNAKRDPIVAPLSQDFKANPLAPDLAAKLAPEPPPGSVGAMGTPSSMIPALTPAEAATAEGRQFQQTAIDRQDSGQDRSIYVPNSKPTDGTMNPQISPTENALRNFDPQSFKKSDDENNAARVEYLDSRTSDPIALQNMKETRDTQATTDLAPMKADPQPVDLQPVKDIVERQLQEGGEDRGLVASTLNSVAKTLQDADGNLRTDPNRIYNGARKNITDMLARGKADPASNEATATAHLMEIKSALDDAISQSNPSFETYLNNYQKNSMPLDEADVLANVRSKVVNGQGNMMLGALNQQLANIVKARANPAVNPAKSLTPDSMDMLFNLKADLQRKAYAESMNQGVGSNTVRQTLQAAKTGTLNPLLSGAIGLATDVATAHFAGPLGLIGRRVMTAGTNKLLDRRTAKANNALNSQVDQMINPR